MIGTYKIINKKIKKYYYGSSIDIEKRLKRHKNELGKNKHHSIYLQRAYNKYGCDNFEFVADEIFDKVSDARDREQFEFDNNNTNLYNVSMYASGGDLISYHPNRDEIVKKMTISVNKRYCHFFNNFISVRMV